MRARTKPGSGALLAGGILGILLPRFAIAEPLPLKHGVYVTTDTQCSHASFATVTTYDGAVLVEGHFECKPTVLSRSGVSYTLSNRCYSARDDSSIVGMETYIILSPSSFTVRHADGSAVKDRWCDKRSLPFPWGSSEPEKPEADSPAVPVEAVIRFDANGKAESLLPGRPDAFMLRTFTEGFNKSWANAMEHSKDEAVLDGDPVTGQQGVSKIELQSTDVAANGEGGIVTAHLLVTVDGSSNLQPIAVNFSVRREADYWKIDDIAAPDTQSLREYFKKEYELASHDPAVTLPIRQGYYADALYSGLVIKNECKAKGQPLLNWDGRRLSGSRFPSPPITISPPEAGSKMYGLHFRSTSNDTVLTPAPDGQSFDLSEEHFTWCAATLADYMAIPKEPPKEN